MRRTAGLSTRFTRLAAVIAITVLDVALVTVVVVGSAASHPDAPARSAHVTVVKHAAPKAAQLPADLRRGDHRVSVPPSLNVYVGPADVSGLQADDRRLGGAVSGAFDYLPGNSWQALSDPAWLIRAWPRAKLPLTLAVPMLPNTGASLARGAAGDYDRYFKALAARLVNGGLGHSTLVIGWEPETSGHAWSVSTVVRAREYVRYWRRIHKLFARVPGGHFRFVWDIADPTANLKPAATYPGNGYVDTVATAAFDTGFTGVPAADQWQTTLNGSDGAAWAAAFAKQRHKRLAVMMLGVSSRARGGGGDNGGYVRSALRWAAAEHAVSVTFWDYRASLASSERLPRVAAAITAAFKAGALR